MPAYDFKNLQGEVREFIVPSSTVGFTDENGVGWSKVATPPRIAIGGWKPETQAEEVKRGYHRMEQRGWKSKYTKSQVKKAWSI
mgnify:CR=1 FL=1|tara:strand:- start:4142 stop:4393 length:252 start_codon:yes stop_codon:yes gene_type:complete